MDEKSLKNEIALIEDRVKSIVVNDGETYAEAGNIIISVTQYEKQVHAFMDDDVKKADELHKSLTGKRNLLLKPAKIIKDILNDKTSAYLTEKERVRQEEQRKIDEARRKQEEAERAKLESRAAKAEESGKAEKAEALREQASDVYIPPVIVQPEVAKTTHIGGGTASQTKDIKITVTDPKKILAAVVDGRLPIGIITINESKLKQAIKLSGINHIDGAIIEQVVNAQFRARTA